MLYHPVLPLRENQKLMFLLSRTCVIASNTGECTQTTDNERALTGTWIVDEVRLAVEKGYRIFEIYEVYEYKVKLYDPKHMNAACLRFLKLKAEANGYPDWVRSSADEERYTESFWKSEGIRLDKESIKTNAAKRGLAEICLTSMWDKFHRAER